MNKRFRAVAASEGGRFNARRVVVAMGAAVVVLVAVGVVVFVRGASEDPAPAANQPPAVELPGLVEPSGEADALPAEGAVGAGVLVFTCRKDCDTMLLLGDGTQRLLAYGTGGVMGFSLSADGHWLTIPDQRDMVVRELTGDRVHRVEAAAGRAWVPWAWSPGSRWVLLAEAQLGIEEPAPAAYHLLDLAEGNGTPVAALPGREFVAVLPSGQLWAAMSSPTPVGLTEFSKRTGTHGTCCAARTTLVLTEPLVFPLMSTPWSVGQMDLF